MKKPHGNSNASKILSRFAGQTVSSYVVASYISTSAYRSCNSGSMAAAGKALQDLRYLGLAKVAQFGPRGGYYSATWEISAR